MISGQQKQLLINCAIILASLIAFATIGRMALSKRSLAVQPVPGATISPVVVDQQRDVYAVYQGMQLRGATVVHLNRHFNLVMFSPDETKRSDPFPISVPDRALAYEKGLDSHNWLYIAARTSMVRNIITVLPQRIFQTRFTDMRDDPEFTYAKRDFTSYSFDVPRTITTLATLGRVSEPVIVNVDAGYFLDGADPQQVVLAIKNALPDIRGLVLVRSVDELDIDRRSVERLERMETIWKGTR
jgi:hypothetical protein